MKDFKVHTRWIEQDYTPNYEPFVRSQYQKNSTIQYLQIEIDGKLHEVGLPNTLLKNMVQAPIADVTSSSETASYNMVAAPMSGVITKWNVTSGEYVESEQIIGIMEAMKMEVPIVAHKCGVLNIIIDTQNRITADTSIASIDES